VFFVCQTEMVVVVVVELQLTPLHLCGDGSGGSGCVGFHIRRVLAASMATSSGDCQLFVGMVVVVALGSIWGEYWLR